MQLAYAFHYRPQWTMMQGLQDIPVENAANSQYKPKSFLLNMM